MATAGEGESTAAAATTSGAGGKFRKIPFRRGHRPTTPYDRPPSSMRGINSHNNDSNNSGSLFAKLVVDPASKLINYGANRFFASVFRKRLPPTPPQPPEVNGDLIDEPHVAVSNDQGGAQKSGGGDFTQPLNSSSSNEISELEQLLKQKTFSRSEIDHLIELLQSRAVESSFRVESQITQKVGSDSGRNQPIASGPLEENINEGDRFLGVLSTPIINSRVIEDDLASPAELAKAYMGSRTSKVSPSMLGTRSSAENGFVTPKSRGRLAIYNMARTPYSRIHPHSIQKGIGLTNNGNGGPSMPSYRSLLEQSEKFESKPLALKRRNSVLDDDLGSVGPIRRIRQKRNLLASRTSVTASGTENGSDSVIASSKQKLPLIVKPQNSVSKAFGAIKDDSIPSASYTHVPSRSSEVAARILQHLENLTPKEKSSESKLVKLREKSPLGMTSSILGRQAVETKEDVDSPQLLPNFQDGQTMEDKSTATFSDARDSTFQKLGSVGQTSTENSVVCAGLLNHVMKNDFVESLKAPGPCSETAHSIVKNGVAQPTPKERAFRMSAQKDDDINSYEISPGPLAEAKGPKGTPFVDNDTSVTKEPILLKANNQPKAMMPSGHILNKTTESGNLGGHMIGLGNGGTVFPPLSAAVQSKINPHSVDLFGKLKGTEDLPPSSHFSFRNVDKFPPLLSESSNGIPVLRSENSSSLVNVLPTATGSQWVIPESDQSGLLHPLKAGDANGKSQTLPSTALNGPLVLSSPAASLTAVSPCDANQISTTSSSLFNPSTSIGSFGSNGKGTSTSVAISGNLFGSNVAPSVLGGPVATFGAFVDPTNAVSAALTANDTSLVDLKTKAEKESNFSCSSGMHSALASFAVATSGSSASGLDTSASYSTAYDLQCSPFTGANKFLVSGVGTVSQSTSIQSVSSVSVPSSNKNSSISFGTSLSNSQSAQRQIFSFDSSASLSDSVVASSSESAPSISRFGGSSVMTSVPNTTSSFSSGTTGMFKFGASSLAPSSVPNTASSFSSGASDVFKSGASSSAPFSASSNFLSSNTTPSNVFGSTSPFSGFSFGASSATFAPTGSTSAVFNSSTSLSSSPVFSFSAASPAMSSPPPNITQSMFGNEPSSSAASPGNGDQMNTDDSMAEDPVQYSAPSIPVFGQPAVSPSPSGFMFGSTAASPANPFSFGGQQNQVTPLNPSPFQGSGGSFSLGSGGGGDKSTRKFIKVNRSKNRKK